MLCSVITTSAIGVSQVSSTLSASSAFFSSLGQKLKEGTKAAANYLWKNEKTTMFSALAVGSVSLFPKAAGKFITGIGKAIEGGVMSLWKLPPGAREIVAITILMVGSKYYQKWYNNCINKKAEEKIENDTKKKDELREDDLNQVRQVREIYDKFEHNNEKSNNINNKS